jgi:dipeptidyl aminopeptidase/acylaminoacyl peptidase
MGASLAQEAKPPRGAWPFIDPRPDDPSAARRRPVEIRDLYRLKGVGSPQVSPDGRRVVFVRSTSDLEKGKSQSNLWILGVDGKGLRQLTRSEEGDHSPRFSPDGKWIYFVSGRKKGAQLFRLSLDGGDPEQLTRLSTGVSGPVVSPDGRRVAFKSRVFPEHPTDDSKNKARMEARRKGPVQAHLADELLFRHWTRYDDGRRAHILLLDTETLATTDLTPGDWDSPPFSLGSPGEYAFAPEGDELCFVSNREPRGRLASSTNSDVFVVKLPRTGGGVAEAGRQGAPRVPPARGSSWAPPTPINVTAANKAWDGSCGYSPDGRYLSYRFQTKPGYESDRFRLAILERSTGKNRVLTEGFDHWVDEYAWLPGGKGILFNAPVRGRWPLFRLDLASGEISRLPAPPTVREWALAPQGNLIAFTHCTVSRPTELFVISTEGATPRALTEENRSLTEEVDFRPVEELWLPGDGGQKIHVFLVKPHGFEAGKRYPLILNVHGGPQYQWSDSFRGDWQVYPAKGYLVAFPNTTGSIGYGQAFTEAISKDWGGKVYRDTMAVTEALAGLPYVDGSRIGIMGWSYGGYLVNWVIGQTRRFKAAASMMGVYDLRMFFATTEEQWFPEWDLGGDSFSTELWGKWSPSGHARNIRTPTLILTGQLDFRIPYTQSIALFTDLRRQGVPARLIVFENDGHWPDPVSSMPVYYNAHLEWFARHLGGGPAPWKTEDMVKNQIFGKKEKQ